MVEGIQKMPQEMCIKGLAMSQKIKTWWWEEDDFHIISEKGEHIVFENAYVSDVNYDFGENENIKIEDLKIEDLEKKEP